MKAEDPTQTRVINAELLSHISGIQKIEDITQLDLSSKGKKDKFKKIENLESLISLDSLNLSYNSISVIENLTTLTKLTELDLSNNSLTSFNGLQSLGSLKILDLSSNRIISIPKFLPYTCPNIEILNIQSNLISSYLSVTNLCGLESLRILNLLENPILNLSDSRLYIIHCLKSLQVLNNGKVSDVETTRAEKLFKIASRQDFDSPTAPKMNLNEIQKITEHVQDIETQIKSKNIILQQQSEKLSTVIKTQQDFEDKLQFYMDHYAHHGNHPNLPIHNSAENVTPTSRGDDSADIIPGIGMKLQLLDSLELMLKEKTLAIEKSNAELYSLKSDLTAMRAQIFRVSNDLVKGCQNPKFPQPSEVPGEIREKMSLIGELEDINRQLNIGLGRCEQKIHSDEAELKELRDSYGTGTLSEKEVAEQIVNVENNLVELRRSKEEIKVNLTKVVDKIQQESAEVKKLEMDLEAKDDGSMEELYEKELDTIISHLRNVINNLESQIEEKEAANNRLITINDQLMETLFKFEQNVSEMHNKAQRNEDLEKTIERLMEDNKKLSNFLDSMKHEYSRIKFSQVEISDSEASKQSFDDSSEIVIKGDGKCDYDNNGLRKLELINNILKNDEDDNKTSAEGIEEKVFEILSQCNGSNSESEKNLGNYRLARGVSKNSVSFAHSESINQTSYSDSGDSQSVTDGLCQRLFTELQRLKNRINTSATNRKILVQLMNDELRAMTEKLREANKSREVGILNLNRLEVENKGLKEDNVGLNLKNENLSALIREKDKLIAEKESKNNSNENILDERDRRVKEMAEVIEDLTEFRNNFLEIMNLNDFNFFEMITENMDVKEAGTKTKIYSIVKNFYKRMRDKIPFCSISEHENKIRDFERLVQEIESNKSQHLLNESIIAEKARLTGELNQLKEQISRKTEELSSWESKISKTKSEIEDQNHKLGELRNQKTAEQYEIGNLVSSQGKLRNQNMEVNKMIQLAMVELQKQKSELEDNKDRISLEHEKLKKLLNILETKNAEYNNLVSECEHIEGAISDLKKESDEVSEFTLAKYNNVGELDREILERSITLKDLESRITREMEKYEVMRSNRTSFEHDYSLIESQREDQASQLQRSITELEITLDSKNLELENLDKQRSLTLMEFTEISDKTRREGQRLEEIRNQIFEKEKELEVLNSDLTRNSKEIRKFIEEKDAELKILDNIKSHQTRLIRENSSLANAPTQFDVVEDQRQHPEFKSTHFRRRKVSFENERQGLNELESVTNQKRDDLKAIIDRFEHYQDSMAELEAEYQAKNTQVENLKDRRALLQEEFKQIENVCNEMKNMKSVYGTEIERLEAQITESRKMHDGIVLEYQKYHEQLENLHNEIFLKSCELSEISNSIQVAQQHISQQNGAIQQMRDGMDLEAENKTMISDINCMILRIERLEHELNNKNKENNELRGLFEMRTGHSWGNYDVATADSGSHSDKSRALLVDPNNIRNRVLDTISDYGQSFETSQQRLVDDLQRIRQKILTLENVFTNNDGLSRFQSSQSHSRSSSRKRPTRDTNS